MQLNGLTNFFIYPGQKLKVPGGSSSSSSSNNTRSNGGYYSPTFNHQNFILGDNVHGTYLIDVLK